MKIILTIALSLFSLFSFSQDSEIKFHCYYVQTGVFNKYYQKTDYGEKLKTDFEVTLYKGSFRFENKAGSLYILKNQKKQTEYMRDRTVTLWEAIDEEGKPCSVQIIKFIETGNVQVQCFYSDIIFIFYMSPL